MMDLEFVSSFIDYINRCISFFSKCTSLPIDFPGCHAYWLIVFFFAELVGVLLAFYFIAFYICKMRGYKNYKNWLADQHLVEQFRETITQPSKIATRF